MRRALALLSVVAVGAIAACGTPETSGGPAAEGFPMTVQNCGRDVTFDAPAGRILTIGAEAPTLVAAAGGADRVVARSGEYGSPMGEYESALQGATQLTTDTDDPTIEAIIAQKPDLVVTRGSEDAAALEAVGIKRLVISGRCRGPDNKVSAAGTFDEVFADIELYGRILGTQDAATASLASLRGRVTAVQEQFRARPARRAAAAIYSGGGEQFGSYGGLSVVHQQMTALGLTNVFGEVPERFFEPSLDEVIARDPEVFVELHPAARRPAGLRGSQRHPQPRHHLDSVRPVGLQPGLGQRPGDVGGAARRARLRHDSGQRGRRHGEQGHHRRAPRRHCGLRAAGAGRGRGLRAGAARTHRDSRRAQAPRT